VQILVVDDEVMIADSLADALEDNGHVVCGVASTVAEGVALARRYKPDIGIFDMQLHGQERGSDIADQLLQSGDLNRMGILYVTGQGHLAAGKANIGEAWLSKPYTFVTLHLALEIVRDIKLDGRTSRALPHGLQLLQVP
jgi:DNA-binding response OmpR family regulator